MPRWAADLRDWVPRWWRGEGGAAGRLLDPVLWPAEMLYRGLVRARNAAYDSRVLRVGTARIPVVSVGNLAVGGAGKTPFSAWLAGRLAGRGLRPAIVLRGYGSDEVRVHQELNPGMPVIAAPRRAEGVERAVALGCDVAVLDDGFQHRSLARSLDVVLVAAEGWSARRRLLPRGPWREDAASLARAGALVVTRKTAPAEVAAAVAADLRRLAPGAPVAVCRIEPTRLAPLHGPGREIPLEWLRGRSVLAVASLADPRPFARHLADAGARLEMAAFPDHHEFTPGEAEALRRRAAGRPLVMTRKEAVKLRALLPPETEACLLDQRVVMEEGLQALDGALAEAVAS